MNKIILKGLDETVFHEKLDNGLNIYVLRKKDYNTYTGEDAAEDLIEKKEIEHEDN